VYACRKKASGSGGLFEYQANLQCWVPTLKVLKAKYKNFKEWYSHLLNVDFDTLPLHNYRANLKDLGDTKLYLGSINNYLLDTIKGKFSEEKGIPKRVCFTALILPN
jgi:hypothetical protein